MRKPRVLLSFVLILLVINATFFIVWYGFDLQGKVSHFVESQVGSILNGKLIIGSLSIGDRQIIARDISFVEDDDTYAFTAKELRVRYNLLKLIIYRGDLAKCISNIDITIPYVEYHYVPSLELKPKSDVEIPDLTKYFGALSIKDGSALITLRIPTTDTDTLYVRETITSINASLKNTDKSAVSLRCVVGSAGTLQANAVLDKGAISNLEAELRGFEPSFVEHPLVQKFHSEVSVSATINQVNSQSQMHLSYNALLWNTNAEVMDYQIQIPFIAVKGGLEDIHVDLAKISVNESSVSGSFSITDFNTIPQFETKLELDALNLGMINESLNGIVRGNMSASGSFTDPVITASFSSDSVQYDTLLVSDIKLSADFKDKILEFELENAIWENQQILSSGSLDTNMMDLSGTLTVFPLDPESADVNVSADISFNVGLYSQYPIADIQINNLSVVYYDIDSGQIHGSVALAPLELDGVTESYLAEVKLSSTQGVELDAIGDILNRSISLKLKLMDLTVTEVFSNELTKHHNPILGGEVLLIMTGDKLFGSTDLHIVTSSDIAIDTELGTHFSYDMGTKSGALNFKSNKADFNGQPVDLSFYATYENSVLNLANLNLNNVLLLSGKLNTLDPADFSFSMMLKEISSDYIQAYIDFLDIELPIFKSASFNARYNTDSKQEIFARAELSELLIEQLNPLSAELDISGDTKALVLTGAVKDRVKNLLEIEGTASIVPTVDIDLTARTENLVIADILKQAPLQASFSSDISLQYKDILGEHSSLTFAASFDANSFSYQDYKIDSLKVVIAQTPELIKLDELMIYSDGLLSARGSGALDYNFFTNTFFEGDNELTLDIEIELLKWLKNNIDYVEDAKGSTKLSCVIGTYEEEFFIREGQLTLIGSNLKLKDQMEPISDFRFVGDFVDNRFFIKEGVFEMGQGRLHIRNYFDLEPSDHFMVGMLDLGIFEIRTNNNGILFNLPDFTIPRALSKAVIRGRNSDHLVVKGPFDAMKIQGDILVSNARLVYPPNTENLLKLISSVRDAATSKPASDPIPLPFTLDLMVIVGDNNYYETYPLNVQVSSNSFIHLLYDGLYFSVGEANFIVERGTIDFVGTLFQVDFVSVSIIEAQNIMNVEGTFYRRAADGTMITLTVSTPYDPDKDLINRLEFNLSSDNPQDRTISHIISRLRYNESIDELTPEQRQSLLQDDALNLVSQNLNTTILTPFFHPIENRIRRFLRLDSFNIRAGFIQNLFSEYASDPSQLSAYTNLNQMDAEIVKLSSSILLNNLSVSMSKYLGRKFFLDYKFSLEEATNITDETRILVSHDTSLRMLLPWRLRIAYTLKYEAAVETFSHGVMVQRSFRF